MLRDLAGLFLSQFLIIKKRGGCLKLPHTRDVFRAVQERNMSRTARALILIKAQLHDF